MIDRLRDRIVELILRLDPVFWREATLEDFALYFGLLALGALFILGLFFRVRLKVPGRREADDHSHPMN